MRRVKPPDVMRFFTNRKGKKKMNKKMEADTKKRLAKLNGKMLKKAVSVTKTLVAGDDAATVELVGQMTGLAGEMATVVNRYGNGAANIPQPKEFEGVATVATDEVEQVPTGVIADKIDEKMPAEYDLHKVIRENGKVIALFEPTEKEEADLNGIELCKQAVVDAGMVVEAACLKDADTVVAIELKLDAPDGDPILKEDQEAEAEGVADEEDDETEETEEPTGSFDSPVPTREKMLEVMTLTVARAVDVVNRHVEDQDPSVRKLEAAMGFKDDLKFLLKKRFAEGTKEYVQAEKLLGTIRQIAKMVDRKRYTVLEQVPMYEA